MRRDELVELLKKSGAVVQVDDRGRLPYFARIHAGTPIPDFPVVLDAFTLDQTTGTLMPVRINLATITGVLKKLDVMNMDCQRIWDELAQVQVLRFRNEWLVGEYPHYSFGKIIEDRGSMEAIIKVMITTDVLETKTEHVRLSQITHILLPVV